MNTPLVLAPGNDPLRNTFEPEARPDLRHYAQVLWRARLLIVVAGLLGLGLATLFAYVQTPVYRANAMLQIDPPTPMFMNVTDALVGAGSYWQNADFYNTQFKILKSKGLGDKVVERLKLKDQPEFQGAVEPGAVFMSHVLVEPVPESRLVNVAILHTDPARAAEWANTLAELFIKESVQSRMQQAAQVLEWLNEQVKTTQEAMQSAQSALLQGLQRQDLVVGEGSQSAVNTSIQKLNEEYIQARARRIEIEAALRQIRDLRARNQSLDAVPQVAADQGVRELTTQVSTLELQLSTLRGRLRDGHPEMQKVRAQIDQARQTRADRSEAVGAGLESEYAQLQKREAQLQAAITGQRSQAADQSLKAAELETLRKQTESTKNLYDTLLQKLNETNIAASMRNSSASIVERAAPPTTPVRPDKRRLGLLGLLIGLAAGIGLVLLRDYFDNTLGDPDEVERYLQTDVLAAVPRAADERLMTEAYQNLRTALLFARRGENGHVVLITGTAPQEGKTTTLVNLGRLLAASAEPTLLVDCDLRRAQVHDRLALRRQPGLTDYFVSNVGLESLIQPTGTPGLSALAAGPLPPNPPAILARTQVGELFAELRRRYRWILVDSPPLASVTDAALLARHADMVVAVVQHSGVDKRLVKRAVSALRRMNANFVGVVLNLVELRAGGYDYYYHSRYDVDAWPADTTCAAKGEPARGFARREARSRE